MLISLVEEVEEIEPYLSERLILKLNRLIYLIYNKLDYNDDWSWNMNINIGLITLTIVGEHSEITFFLSEDAGKDLFIIGSDSSKNNIKKMSLTGTKPYVLVGDAIKNNSDITTKEQHSVATALTITK